MKKINSKSKLDISVVVVFKEEEVGFGGQFPGVA